MNTRYCLRTTDPELLVAARREGLEGIVATVLANRAGAVGVTPGWLLDRSLAALDHPDTLPDIALAAQRIASAVERREVIGIVTDADSDGVNANTVLYRALTEHFGHPVAQAQQYIGLKLTEGYGLSDGVADRILAAHPRPGLLITADIGSSDGLRIARLRREGIDVVVTDHHGIPPGGGPEAAVAFVNPQRGGHAYPDPLIAGVMVAWLVVAAVRRELQERGTLPADAPRLGNLLGWVGTGTVADVVSLARSRNNRIVVHHGLRQIGAGTHPCWRALRPELGDPAKPLAASDIAFGIGPRLNAAGRLHDAMTGVRFLLAADAREAAAGLAVLNAANLQRREIEKRLTAAALAAAQEQVDTGRRGLVVFMPDGHAGVQGIVASRLMQRYARPAVCLSQVSDSAGLSCWSGSGRSGDTLHLLELLQTLDARNPGLLVKYGGHAAAAGLTLNTGDEAHFAALFDAEVRLRLAGLPLENRVWVDADVAEGQLSLGLVERLAEIGPYGREFPEPVLRGVFTVHEAREIGSEGGHWRLKLGLGRQPVDAIWFGVGHSCPVTPGEPVRLVFRPEANWWQGTPRLQLQILGIAREADS
jgi:single-stranded-DNA-specific exonuclease